MAKAHKCDKCGKLFEVEDGADILFSYPKLEDEERPKILRYNLCFECVNDVACFIELNEKVETNE